MFVIKGSLNLIEIYLYKLLSRRAISLWGYSKTIILQNKQAIVTSLCQENIRSAVVDEKAAPAVQLRSIPVGLPPDPG
jgi:hypothetical protein